MNTPEDLSPVDGSKRLLDVLENQIVPLLEQLLEQQREIIQKADALGKSVRGVHHEQRGKDFSDS